MGSASERLSANSSEPDLREKHESDLARFREAGLIECERRPLKLTRAGALMSNEVFAAFV